MSYDTLRNTLCNELEEFASKGELNTGDLDVIHKLTDTIKNTYKIEMYEDGGYSRGGEWEADMRGAYGRGNSYTNRGQHYVRGHYSRDGEGGGHSQRGYGREGSRDEMLDKLQMMYENARNEKEREALRRCLEQMNQA
jgi:hypothetical protein